MPALRPIELIASRILVIRAQRAILDTDLAALYGVTTRRLNEQVKRNSRRFPADFMFKLTATEKQQVVANCDHLTRLKFSRNLPYVFTEHGAIQAANVLNSQRAVETGVHVVRAFVGLREVVASNTELIERLTELERKVGVRLGVHDKAIAALIKSLQKLATIPPVKKWPIGFVHSKE